MLLLLSVIVCLVVLAILLQIACGYEQLESLDAITPRGSSDQPLVSIVVPSCNEELSIEASLRSLCNLDYAHVEIIVVDDRSVDRTAEIVEAVRRDFPAIRLLRISELPGGLAGKATCTAAGSRQR